MRVWFMDAGCIPEGGGMAVGKRLGCVRVEGSG